MGPERTAGLSPRAAGGRGTLRRRVDSRKAEIPWSPAVRVQMAARIRVRLATVDGEIELGGGLVTPDVQDLAQTQLHQPVQAGLHGLAEEAIGCESRTVLEREGDLQQGFLRMQTDLPPAVRSSGHTAEAERTGLTELRVRVERTPRLLCCGGRGIGAPPAHGARHLTRRTGAIARRQVDLEILPGKVGLSRSFQHFDDQGSPGVAKLLAVMAIPIGRIGDGGGYRYAGVLFTLGHQLQRTLEVQSGSPFLGVSHTRDGRNRLPAAAWG